MSRLAETARRRRGKRCPRRLAQALAGDRRHPGWSCPSPTRTPPASSPAWSRSTAPPPSRPTRTWRRSPRPLPNPAPAPRSTARTSRGCWPDRTMRWRSHRRAAATPLVLSAEVIDWIARTYRARVDRSQAEGVRVSAPDLPSPEAIELMGQTVAALGEDCPEAWLVAMTADGAAPRAGAGPRPLRPGRPDRGRDRRDRDPRHPVPASPLRSRLLAPCAARP